MDTLLRSLGVRAYGLTTAHRSSLLPPVASLGFNRADCEYPATRPVLRADNTTTRINVRVTVIGKDGAGNDLVTLAPLVTNTARCNGVITVKAPKSCASSAVVVNPMAGDAGIWAVVSVAGTSQVVNIVAHDKGRRCRRFLAAQKACANTLLALDATDDRSGLQRWRVSPVWKKSSLDAGPGFHASSFGHSVAVSADGNTAVVGAPGSYMGYYGPCCGTISNRGKTEAFVFTNTNGFWDLGISLGTGDTANDAFGSSVSVAGDGKTAVVGAPESLNNTGQAFVFTKTGGAWDLGVILGTGDTANDAFGSSVSVAGDGKTAVVGAPGSLHNAGQAFVFTKTGGAWDLGVILGTGKVVEGLGSSISMSGDGKTVVVGAPKWLDVPSTITGTGQAFVFTKMGGVWDLGAILGTGEEAGEGFGESVSVSGDGKLAVVGAPYAFGQGRAYMFTRIGGNWELESVVDYAGMSRPREAECLDGGYYCGPGPNRGRSVSVSGDGKAAIVGVPGNNLADAFTQL